MSVHLKQEVEMSNEITRAADRRMSVRQQRVANQRKDEVTCQVQLTDYKIKGAAVVGVRFMDTAVEVDAHRRELAGDDVGLNMLLGEIEANFVRQGKRIQNGLYDEFGG